MPPIMSSLDAFRELRILSSAREFNGRSNGVVVQLPGLMKIRMMQYQEH